MLRSIFNGSATAVGAAAFLCCASLQNANGEPDPPFERTEDLTACDDYDPLKRPFFGETHLHTSYSFDAYNLNVRNTPDMAYAFAKGAEVTLPAWNSREGDEQTRTAQLRRPIDFAAITDHSELLGPMQICTRDPDAIGYGSIQCQQERTGLLNPADPASYNPEAVAGEWASLSLLFENFADPLFLCNNPGIPGVDCPAAEMSIWQDIQRAAADAYEPCSFTSFIAYEYTAQPALANLHRNVIFRNSEVPEAPVDNVTIDGPTPISKLWDGLEAACLDNSSLENCDVLTIPHNANLSGEGQMFLDPSDAAEAEQRAFFEPLTEIYQHKGSSECRYDRLAHAGVDTDDKLCTFEQLENSVLGPQPNPPDIYEFSRRNMIRNVLKDGMALAPDYDGVNPFKLGIIGGTDSHNGDPGDTVEQDFQGHAGSLDAPVANMIGQIRLSPGALAVVWAEENTRDAIFSAMRRKETYATSGTRPIVRFFGGWGFDDRRMRDLCRRHDRVKIGYKRGVPMGGDLPPQSRSKPSFLVAALSDAESVPLDRIQIVKGWVDASGETHERVFDVAGSRGRHDKRRERDACNPSTFKAKYGGNSFLKEFLRRIYDKTDYKVDPWRSGRRGHWSPPHKGRGANQLCTVWTDRTFNPAQRAFYYVRVLEEPTCRWSTLACKAAGVDPFASPSRCQLQAAAANAKAIADGEIQDGDTPFDNCCLTERNDPFMERTIQERAWTSPIWYTPGE